MRTDIRLVPAHFLHINRVANKMREIDRAECEAFGNSPKQALRAALMRSEKAWTVLEHEQPIAMFGVVVQSALTREAVPWLLGTDAVYRHGRALLMWGPPLVEWLHSDSTYRLSNLVSSRNSRAIRLLERWGFTVHHEEQEIGGELFRVFEKEPAKLCANQLLLP